MPIIYKSPKPFVPKVQIGAPPRRENVSNAKGFNPRAKELTGAIMCNQHQPFSTRAVVDDGKSRT